MFFKGYANKGTNHKTHNIKKAHLIDFDVSRVHVVLGTLSFVSVSFVSLKCTYFVLYTVMQLSKTPFCYSKRSDKHVYEMTVTT